ncbi:MAG: hypothetical protein JKY03_08790 [Aureispira sp.]|nr:hypothetical protein [Aureispira sp.]
MIIHKNIRLSLSFLFAACLIFVCYNCDSGNPSVKKKDLSETKPAKDFTVRILLRGNPDGFNILLAQTALSSAILDPNVHCGLLDMDPKTFEYHPYLAKAQPEIKELEDGNISISYEIREEAVWDNGSPITAEDYAFTIKAIKNPKTNAANNRTFVEFIEKINIDPNNLKKFTIICNKRYLLAKAATGTMAIIPSYFYDKQGFMADFTISELNDPANLERLNKDPRIVDFANDFNENYTTFLKILSVLVLIKFLKLKLVNMSNWFVRKTGGEIK